MENQKTVTIITAAIRLILSLILLYFSYRETGIATAITLISIVITLELQNYVIMELFMRHAKLKAESILNTLRE